MYLNNKSAYSQFSFFALDAETPSRVYLNWCELEMISGEMSLSGVHVVYPP